MNQASFPWVRYVSVAATLGLVWFGVLHAAKLTRDPDRLPRATRDALGGRRGRSMGLKR